MHKNTTHTTLSSEQSYIEMFMRISSRVLTAASEDEFMHETLADVGKIMQVHRTYVFKMENDVWSNTHEWVAEGVVPFIDELQNRNMHELSNSTQDMLYVLASGKPFIINNIKDVTNKNLRDFLKLQDIHGLLTIPLFAAGEIVGMFGLDQCSPDIPWTEQSVNTSIIIASLINNAKTYFATQRKLENKKLQVQKLFDAFPFPIYVANRKDYSVLFCNKIIRDLFDTSILESTPCHKIFQNLDEPCPFCTNDQLVKGAPPYIWHHHNPVLNKDYKIIDRCMDWEQVKDARLSIALDITESLNLQREQVLEREANIAKGRFVANMSHELRTPLNGIIGMAHLAEHANTDATIGNFLDKIQISSKNLLSIINDILDFSKIENEELHIEQLPFNFTEVLFEIQTILQTHADNKGINLQCIIDDNIPLMLQGDSLRLSQIILNLATNAIKFTQKGSVTLEVQAKECVDTVQYIDIIVKDTGIGIAKKNLQKLFTEFSQAEASTSRNYGGTGLGLAIVGRLVELMGGNIEVESTVGEGSTFTCHLSFVKSSKQTLSKDEIIEETANEDIAGIKILLVEDNEINTLVATEVLELYGCVVEHAGDGIIALKMLEDNTYDIVIMDIQMPNMDGLEAAKFIRSKERYNNMPIVAMSAHAMIQDHEKSHAAGMQDHITKPFVPKELRSIIYKYVSKPFTYSNKQNVNTE